MTLRARLVVAFLAVALIPIALFTIFTLDQLDQSTLGWFRPGVDHALESALEADRTGITRLDAIVLAAVDDWVADWASEGGDLPLAPRAREAASERLRTSGLDFLQVYERDPGGHWRLAEQITAEKLIVPRGPDLGAELAVALDSTRLVHSAHGALAAVARIPALRRGRQRAVLVGVAVPQDFFVQADRVAAGLQHYRRLGVVVDLQRLYLWLLVAGLVAGLVALALPLSTLLARGMARPLTELSAAIGRVARGELSARVEPRGAPELKALGASFNAMTERLAVSRDVSRLLAHEIRNSLTPMRLALHRLLRRLESMPAGERAVAQESLGSLLQEVHDLERLSDEFSQVARLPAPQFERVDLVEVARTAAVLHGPERVRTTIPAGLTLPVWGDRLLLARALHNLFLNACEASPDGGTVEVKAMREDGEATIEVLDRGEGVPDAVRDRAFEPGVSSKGRGSGLGLSLVRDIASQHRGSATLGDREGGGACARFRIPLMRDSELPASAHGAPAKAAR